MREIKFRYIMKCIKEVRVFILTLDELQKRTGAWKDAEAFGDHPAAQVISRDLFTGFKDVHGTEIYGGDIIQHLDEKLKVFFNESMGSWDLEYEGGDCINLVDENGWDAEDFEVIGNIYETK